MSEDVPLADEVRPRLARGVRIVESAVHGGRVLLAPERIFKPDAVAAEILDLCTGTRTVAGMVDALASRYAAPRERIHTDVTALLRALADKRLVDLT